MKGSIRSYFQSMAGRIFVVLLLGLIVFTMLALGLADVRRRIDAYRTDDSVAVDRVGTVLASALAAQPFPHADSSVWIRQPGIRLASATDRPLKADPAMAALVQSRLGSRVIGATAHRVALESCMPDIYVQQASITPRCWLLEFALPDRPERVRLTFNTPVHMSILADSRIIDPYYIASLIAGFVGIAYLAARMAAAPLNRLARAAEALSGNIDGPRMQVRGPREVREAALAFNTMQDRLQQTIRERTYILAAITHDLQTPLTRLRLRLEKVGDLELRERLVADLAQTRGLVEEGLELARSSRTATEPLVTVDLDSLLASLVDDARDTGADISLQGSCDLDVLARPTLLRRCLDNLVDNALKYAGTAAVTAETDGQLAHIHVLDRGPGVPEGSIDRLFEPFVRLETSRSRETGGTGLGLTIARSLAQQNGGSLTIRNRPGGGLDVIVSVPLTHPVRPAVTTYGAHDEIYI